MTKYKQISIRPKPLSKAAFSEFGDVLEASPAGGVRRYLDAFSVVSSEAVVRCWISTFDPVCDASAVVGEFESHPHSSQAFVPLGSSKFLVVVAKSTAQGKPDVANCRAFIADNVGGIIYYPGVWHVNMMAIERTASFFVVQGLVSHGDDVRVRLDQPISIDVSSGS